MVDNPRQVVPWFIDAGADCISIHAEATDHLHRDLDAIRTAGRKAGVALNPGTPLSVLPEVLGDLDYILLMCVDPGSGNQRFIESSRDKIRRLRRMIGERGISALVEIDGGVNLENMASLIRDGAQIFVAGNAVFNHPDPRQAVARMKEIARSAETA
jgi:ribulose-phosphate 3-epimerase